MYYDEDEDEEDIETYEGEDYDDEETDEDDDEDEEDEDTLKELDIDERGHVIEGKQKKRRDFRDFEDSYPEAYGYDEE